MSTELENAAESTTLEPRRKVVRQPAFWILLAVLAVAGIRAWWFSGASQAAAVTEKSGVPQMTAKPPSEDSATNSSLEATHPAEPSQPTMFGSWRDDYYGERTMTFQPDGTGVMVIKLDSVGQAIYGEKLLFNLKWENRDGVLVMQFTGGEPKQAVETISKLWGDRHEQKIELLTETELHLRSTDSQNLYKLKHIEE